VRSRLADVFFEERLADFIQRLPTILNVMTRSSKPYDTKFCEVVKDGKIDSGAVLTSLNFTSNFNLDFEK
jgi:hypothetical protein